MDVDDQERRCPRLGHSVRFGYCRTCGEEMPVCFKVFDCWWERFDVVAYLKGRMPEDEFAKLSKAEPKPKVASLLDLIAQAKKRTSG